MNVVIKCSIKHIFHHNTIMTSLTHCCKQCNNVTVVQFGNACFLLQFMRDSANVTKTAIINTISPEMHIIAIWLPSSNASLDKFVHF